MVNENTERYVDRNSLQMYSLTATTRPDLLAAVLEAHGGIEQWNKIKTIEATYNLSGQLFSSVGYPNYYQPTITIDPHSPKSVFTGLGDNPNQRWVWTPHKVWIETLDGGVLQTLANPRASIAGLAPGTNWNDLHLLYFNGYATWNYLTAPFSFTLPGFSTRELESHHEQGVTWRVLEVTFPNDFPTHNKVQRFFFDEKFNLRRLDYAPDVLGSAPASQYIFDSHEVNGLSFPTLRRVVPQSHTGIYGPRLVLIDIIKIVVN